MQRISIVLLALLLVAPMSAQAVINVSIARVTDTQAIFTFAGVDPDPIGVFDPNTPSQRGARMYWFNIFAGGVFPTAPLTISENTVVITHLLESDTIGTTIDSGAGISCPTAGQTNPLRMYTTGSNKAAGDTITGSATLDLVGTTWAAVGSTGELWYGSTSGGVAITKTGGWTMVDYVPPGPQYHPGDINGDGTVDLQDFGTLKDNFGVTEGAVWATGDLSGDGAVDLQDFGILKDHFGHTNGDSPINAVPEPASMSLLALAGLGLLRRRR